MKSYIEREKVEAILENAPIISDETGEYCGYCCDDVTISAIPDADVRENVRAEWVNYSEYDTHVKQRFNRWSCSECGYVRKRGWEHTSDGNKPRAKYCENCGANMRGTG